MKKKKERKIGIQTVGDLSPLERKLVAYEENSRTTCATVTKKQLQICYCLVLSIGN